MSQHPVLSAAEAIDQALKSVRDVDPVFMSTDAKEAALVTLTGLVDRTAELRLRVLAAADDVAERHGTRNAAAWLAHATRASRRAGSTDRRLAEALSGHRRCVRRSPTDV